MPRRSKKPCAAPGCPALVAIGRFCDAHKPTYRRHDGRVSSAKRGYGRRWRALRLMYLRQHPLCVNPFGLENHIVEATDVDHITPKRNGGTDDEANLQALCHSCHSKKTAAGS